LFSGVTTGSRAVPRWCLGICRWLAPRGRNARIGVTSRASAAETANRRGRICETSIVEGQSIPRTRASERLSQPSWLRNGNSRPTRRHGRGSVVPAIPRFVDPVRHSLSTLFLLAGGFRAYDENTLGNPGILGGRLVVSDSDDDLAARVAVSEVADRGRHLFERERPVDDGPDSTRFEQSTELL